MFLAERAARCALTALFCSILLLHSNVATADDHDVIADGRDRYNLFRPKLLNRQLFEQLSAPWQEHRLGNQWPAVAVAVDADVGSEQVFSPGAEQSRFHGFFIFDSYLAARPISGFDINLNLALYNPSASDGYRLSGAVSPGGALHFYHEHEIAPGHDVRVDVLGTDLDLVTLGAGLLMEHWPNEGAMGRLSYGDHYFEYFFGGRAFYPTDDLIAYTVSTFDDKAALTFADWKFRDTGHHSRYLQLSSRWPLLYRGTVRSLKDASAVAAHGRRAEPAWASPLPPYHVQLRAEVGLRLPSDANSERPPTSVTGQELAVQDVHAKPSAAALLRADTLTEWWGVRLHVGYQFRWYDQGYGPRETLEQPTATYNLPFREEAYVTNSFEYFKNSLFFEQWSHSLMVETSVPAGPYFRVFAETELVLYYAADRAVPSRYLPPPQLARPYWYRAGLRLYPWAGLPHRLSGSFSNKQVLSGWFSQEPVTERFDRVDSVTLQMELFL